MIPRFVLRIVGKVVRRPVLRHIAAFDIAAAHCAEVQSAILERILRQHEETSFGRDHGFDTIRSYQDFRRQVSLAGYERLEPYIARMRRGEHTALISGERVHMFALTSGTTAARKFIPVTDQYLADYRRGWNIWGMRAFLDHQEAKLRPIVQMSSDWNEFRAEDGTPCGSVSGLTAEMQKRLIRFLYCVPPCTGRIKDTTAKYYAVLRLSLPRSVGVVVSANPSTLINLARTGDQFKDDLIRDIHDGTLSKAIDIPEPIRAELTRRLAKADPKRARELESIVSRTGVLFPKDYWSDFICGNWTGGTVGAYLRLFPKYYGDAPCRDVGLIASEGRFTIPIMDGTPAGVLDITSHFFEFVPASEIGSQSPTVLLAHELRLGESYFIVPTTAFGLYRYDIHDLVRVTGFHHATPIVEFLSKGSHFASITGEKVSEYQVCRSMSQALSTLDMAVSTYSLAPCWDDLMPYYGLFVEMRDLPGRKGGVMLAAEFDQVLQEQNIEYRSKRESQRLGPVRLQALPDGAWQSWDARRLAKSGGTVEQYKHPCLISDMDFRATMPVLEELSSSSLALPLATSEG
jgi:hypothetical protein